MKYYSDINKQLYDTEAELIEAEVEAKAKQAEIELEKEEKKAAAKAVLDLFEEANKKYKEANEAMDAFCEKYGSFHYSFKSSDSLVPSTKSLFDIFFNNWLF